MLKLFNTFVQIRQGVCRNCICTLSTMSKATVVTNEDEAFRPPVIVKGMKTLERSLFDKTVCIPAVAVPKTSIRDFMKSFKKFKLTRRINDKKELLAISDNDTKTVLLSPGVTMENFSAEDQEKLSGLKVGKLSSCELTLNYEDYTRKDILRGILPNEEEVASAFTQVGHILHLNLREHLLDYKSVIGAVLLDKIKTAKTVVNKTNEIDNTFRNFSMEVVAGEPIFETRVIENGHKFDLDYSKVFWNSRLQTERDLVCEEINKEQAVFDVFAGIGPFAVRLAKKRCNVFANDLNPESYKWMRHNSKLNKVIMSMFNLDGADFIKTEMKKYICESLPNCKIAVVMNLPAIAIEFLKSFSGLLNECNLVLSSFDNLEICVYCYTFLKFDSKEKDNEIYKTDCLKKILKDSLLGFEPVNPQFHNVRRVSPGKDMYRCKFILPNEILLSGDAVAEPECKRLKISS